MFFKNFKNFFKEYILFFFEPLDKTKEKKVFYIELDWDLLEKLKKLEEVSTQLNGEVKYYIKKIQFLDVTKSLLHSYEFYELNSIDEERLEKTIEYIEKTKRDVLSEHLSLDFLRKE